HLVDLDDGVRRVAADVLRTERGGGYGPAHGAVGAAAHCVACACRGGDNSARVAPETESVGVGSVGRDEGRIVAAAPDAEVLVAGQVVATAVEEDVLAEKVARRARPDFVGQVVR